MSKSRIHLSRRGFMAGATASLAVPTVVSRHALGDEANAPANDKISLAVIGVGKMMYGSHLPHYLKMPEVRVVAVSDVDTTRRETGKKRVDDAYGNTDCAEYVDYREILARDDVDAIACATPDHWHAMVILDTCKAGKDLYCEKPLTNNLMEAKTVMDAVNAAGIIFQTGSQQRASSNFRYACELVQNGRIGKITRVEVSVGGPPRPCNLPGEDLEPGLDWERWLGPAPMRPYSSVLSPRGMHNHFPSWRNFSEFGGGGMTDWGAHHFDIAQWGLGMDKSGPVEIVPPENPKSGHGVKYIYENGVELIHGGKSGVTFFGTDGEIFVNRGKLESKPDGIIKVPTADDEIHLYEAPGGSHAGHRQDWVNCMKSREQPNCPIETGARTVAVCHLGNIAYLHAEELAGKSLKWNPKTWEFVDNDEANQWRDYPYPRREGFELPSVSG
ncbi:MAG: Gfo/Idh/MocA family oxidoreductase [Fuerstiella sp.]|nr:Gfo/Idh/MocA family oxidoreductase [Fuerstiella sp.]MCP4855124.1 Gfo/Idh/MocA family oxidoreductase [Fuerstiella sp.]